MMSKQNYVTFARMIRAQRHKLANTKREPIGTELFYDGATKQIDIILDELCEIFASDNPRFDTEKFIKACEVI